ncbi:ATP-dependent DNA ligase [Aureobasidium sp. EXF-3400]|nr:ATP-dependent DNA ligase [Aureobasidium sp. EXF-12344]KAI4770128.1 ATP-dependent DNA ligase [Aureobasidium sp. EXF-3400]
MPPKQQATLGNFFAKPNGSAPQQSKLSFATKSKPEPKKPKTEDEEEVEDGPSDKKAASTQETAEEATEQPKDDVAPPKPTKTTKKRAVENKEEEEAAASEEEPPTKRQRKKPSKSASPKKPKQEPASDHEEPVKKEKAAPKKPAAKPPTPAKVEEEDIAMKDGSESDPQSEAEDVESDEEEQPEKAAKARAKVQSTFKSNTKDPYPDWKAGDPVPYAALCTTFSKIEMTTKRLEIMAHCSLFLRQVLRLTPQDLQPTVLLMLGKLAADYAGIELGIGESLIMKAIGESTGRSLKIIKEDQQKIGDLGLVAAKSKGSQPTMFKPKPLTVRGVHEQLMTIAKIEGSGGQGRKVSGIHKLLSAADANLPKGKGVDIEENKGGPSEAKFIVRTLEGKMRLGLADKTVLVSMAQAMTYHDVMTKTNKAPTTEQLEKGERVLKNVYNELPSYEVIVPAYLETGIFDLHDACKLQPGVPLKPMLAKPTKSITEVLDRFEGKDFTCEYKYDGERAQIHFVAHDSDLTYATAAPTAGNSSKGVSNIFSRNSEDLSKKYPDILAKLPTWVKDGTKSFVLDCETVAWDVDEKKVLPFQQLMTRKRKDVKTEDIKVKVCVFAFDLLFLNGEALVNQSFRDRRAKLYEAFKEVEGEFAFAQFGNSNELDAIQVLLEDSIKASCEGLMVKMLDGPESYYEPSRRSQNWLKVKKDYLAGAGDSLDLVVLGAYYGRGKRTNVYGAFLLACYNNSSQQYESVCNIGTGFSEALLESLHETLSPLVIDRPKPFYSHSTGNKDQPDVWFEPRLVWEVKTADLTLSPRYKAAADALGDPSGKGVSLRFPRYIRDRDDKKPDDATTARQVAEMYRKQESVGKSKGPAVDDDFEY